MQLSIVLVELTVENIKMAVERSCHNLWARLIFMSEKRALMLTLISEPHHHERQTLIMQREEPANETNGEMRWSFFLNDPKSYLLIPF